VCTTELLQVVDIEAHPRDTPVGTTKEQRRAAKKQLLDSEKRIASLEGRLKKIAALDVQETAADADAIDAEDGDEVFYTIPYHTL
jgi:hypothetical protein